MPRLKIKEAAQHGTRTGAEVVRRGKPARKPRAVLTVSTRADIVAAATTRAHDRLALAAPRGSSVTGATAADRSRTVDAVAIRFGVSRGHVRALLRFHACGSHLLRVPGEQPKQHTSPLGLLAYHMWQEIAGHAGRTDAVLVLALTCREVRAAMLDSPALSHRVAMAGVMNELVKVVRSQLKKRVKEFDLARKRLRCTRVTLWWSGDERFYAGTVLHENDRAQDPWGLRGEEAPPPRLRIVVDEKVGNPARNCHWAADSELLCWRHCTCVRASYSKCVCGGELVYTVG